jgi:hypothetical protein
VADIVLVAWLSINYQKKAINFYFGFLFFLIASFFYRSLWGVILWESRLSCVPPSASSDTQANSIERVRNESIS